MDFEKIVKVKEKIEKEFNVKLTRINAGGIDINCTVEEDEVDKLLSLKQDDLKKKCIYVLNELEDKINSIKHIPGDKSIEQVAYNFTLIKRVLKRRFSPELDKCIVNLEKKIEEKIKEIFLTYYDKQKTSIELAPYIDKLVEEIKKNVSSTKAYIIQAPITF